MKLLARPLWDADDNLQFALFEEGASNPLALIYDYDFEKLVERLSTDLEVARLLDKQRKNPEINDSDLDLESELVSFKLPELDKGPLTLAYYHVKPGDRVKVDQTLFEVESDKASIAIPAVEPGIIANLVGVLGSQIFPGEVILTFASD